MENGQVSSRSLKMKVFGDGKIMGKSGNIWKNMGENMGDTSINCESL
jgi:hypothetical protein